MLKVSFTPLLFGFILAFACVGESQISHAGDGAASAEAGVVLKPAGLSKALHGPKNADHAPKHARVERLTPATSRAAVTGRPLVRADAPMRLVGALDSRGTQHQSDHRGVAVAVSVERHETNRAKPSHEAAGALRVHAAAAVAAPLPREVRQFCSNTATAAVDARVAWQAEQLTNLTDKLKQRIAALEAKRAEYEDWLHMHDEALKQAKEDIVAIYSRMRPDAAAAQLAVMDDVMAASLLAKLNARVASAILAEMDPARAARITNAMVGPVSATGGKKS